MPFTTQTLRGTRARPGLATLIIALGSIATPSAHAQVLSNGGSETVSNQVDTFNGKPVYSAAASWATTGGVLFTGAEGTSGGSEAAVFNGGQAPAGGTLSQTFATVAGTGYTVTFEYGAFGGAGHQVLNAEAGGLGNLGGTVATSDGPSNPVDFTLYSFAFTANSASTTLTFNDTGSDTTNIDGVLDSMQVAPAPEPSSLAAFAFTGLGVVRLMLRARKRRLVA